ncbi:MAG: SMC-Scp complex subunit ScpB [Candidatus Moranbacteria bacterium]|nr:SMC-Scp complex subunit ScpB [Candidatus Moranbacteria bacterium]
MDEKKLESILESLLFVSGEPLKIAKLAKFCGVSGNEVGLRLKNLNEDYQKNGRGLAIIQKEDSVQMTTSAQNAEFVSKLVSGEVSSDLSRSALEVLAIIAYRGPMTRGQIETVRGVNCSYVLRTLLIKGLIERKEGSDIRGYLYETSFEFLKNIGLSNVKELPDWENLSKEEKIEEILKTTEAQEEKG